MSHEVKYIGMDVHKESIVIAVLNVSGKYDHGDHRRNQSRQHSQLIHGLRGELHVTWEEGTWAAWGFTICCSHRCRKLWSAIRGATPY